MATDAQVLEAMRQVDLMSAGQFDAVTPGALASDAVARNVAPSTEIALYKTSDRWVRAICLIEHLDDRGDNASQVLCAATYRVGEGDRTLNWHWPAQWDLTVLHRVSADYAEAQMLSCEWQYLEHVQYLVQ